MIKCRTCASVLHPKAIACSKCGFHPYAGDKYCQSCAAETKPGQVQCISCQERLASYSSPSSQSAHSEASNATSGPFIEEQRKQKLSRIVQQATSTGWIVESSIGYDVVFVGGKRCNHLMHGLITLFGGLFTCGHGLWWSLVWISSAITQKEDRLILHVNENGSVEYKLVTK